MNEFKAEEESRKHLAHRLTFGGLGLLMLLLAAFLLALLAYFIQSTFGSRTADLALVAFLVLVIGSAGAMLALLAWYLLMAAFKARPEQMTSNRLEIGATGLRLLYGLLALMIALALLSLTWLLWNSFESTTAGKSGSPGDMVLLLIILALLGPPLVLLAWSLIRLATGRPSPKLGVQLPALGSDGQVMRWLDFAQLVLSGLLLLAALGSWEEGQYRTAAALSIGNAALILRYVTTHSWQVVARSIGFALILIGLLWLGPIVEGLRTGNDRPIIGGLILWLGFTLGGLALLIVARPLSQPKIGSK